MRGFKKKLLAMLLVTMMLVEQLPVTRIYAEDVSDPEDPTVETMNEDEEGDVDTGAEFSAIETEAGDDSDDEGSQEDAQLNVDYVDHDDVKALSIQGTAAFSVASAAQAIMENTDLSEEEAQEAAEELFEETELREIPDPVLPRSRDGSNIESITVKWITEDTVDNGNDDLLYVKPKADEKQSVRLQINYSLSGEHNYEPGDITITIPASIFKDRDGNNVGSVTIPFPEAPSTRNDFNWNLVGDNYVLTNTKQMMAATKGYIQIGFTDLTPHTLVDMAKSKDFSAYIQVQTHLKNTIALYSDKINAQFDTQAEINGLTKRAYSYVSRVGADEIPDSQRINGVKEYVKVDWYLWGNIKANTMYNIEVKDYIPDEYRGFIIGATSEDGQVAIKTFSKWTLNGNTSYITFSTAYPITEFVLDQEYTFTNNVKMTVTEYDPVNGNDPQLSTDRIATATKKWVYRDPKWIEPEGHFNVFKNGNDGKTKGNQTHHVKDNKHYNTLYQDRYLSDDAFYGIYGNALNKLRDNKDFDFSYTVDSIGYIMPWTYLKVKEGVNAEATVRMIDNWFNRPVKMVTSDDGVQIERFTEKLTVLEDYEFVSLEFLEPRIYSGVPKNINEDGTWKADTYDDGTFEYTIDRNKAHYPQIELEVLINGEWIHYATADWTTGSLVVTLSENAEGSIEKGVVSFSDDEIKKIQNWRTIVTFNNAAINYDVRPVIRIKSNDKIKAVVNEEFAKTDTPVINFWNNVVMSAYAWKEDTPYDETQDLWWKIVDFPNPESPYKDGYDRAHGYTTNTAVYPTKTSSQNTTDVDYESRMITIHYTGKVEIRSTISDKSTYEQALADGNLQSDTHGFWYDLLPKGAIPLLDTIKLRDNDELVDRYTIDNYKGSGRTLLVVEANLTPTPTAFKPDPDSDMSYYEDAPTITFDVLYSFDSLTDYNDFIHNVIAFETSNDSLGTVEHYSGEPDDPNSRNNYATEDAFANDQERGWMKNLDPKKDTPSFVYAGTYTKLDIISAARTSLNKEVRVNNQGEYGSGVWENESEREEYQKIVYTGGQYTYQIRMMADDSTISKNLIIYDSLENYVAVPGDSAIDVPTEDNPVYRWQGTLRSVDVSQLEEKGCAPVVYYSTVDNLQLADENDPLVGIAENMDLTDESIWVKASKYTGDLKNVTAIAVDASKKADESDFELQPLDSVVVLINMQAPSGEEVQDYIKKDAHAYNNAFLTGTTVNVNTPEEQGSYLFTRKDYTKVGLSDYSIDVEKKWFDDNNRDGARPLQIIVHLFASGTDTGKTLILNEENEWKGSFTGIPYCDPDGKTIHYTVREETVENYSVSYQYNTDTEVTINNRHIPARTSVEGNKYWYNDNSDVRPSSIVVKLYANGQYKTQKTVYADQNGFWHYEFTNLYKYENGNEIDYTVEEIISQTVGKSYVTEYDGYDIINKYHPYGDLILRKYIQNTTEISAEKDFTFVFVFTKTVDGEEEPVLNEYEYDILDADENVLRSGKVSSENNKVNVKGNETLHIKDIDEYVKYKVTEESLSGFELVSSSNTQGTIKPNQTSEVSFTNSYSAYGSVQFNAVKTLYSREMKRNQFVFNVYEVTTDENGNKVETLIKQTANENPSEIEIRDDGTLDYSRAEINFGAIHYTEEDAGKTFTYRIEEVAKDLNGFTYDTTVYTVEVTVTDKGDGTLIIGKTYYKDGIEIDKDNLPIPFVNTYKAEGTLVLKAWKDLKGRNLIEDEFTFELYDKNGTRLETKKNNEEGTITFTKIDFNEKDIGKTFYYVIHETKGSDETVNYSEAYYAYKVVVDDYGNGMLRLDQSFVKVNVTEDEYGHLSFSFPTKTVNITDSQNNIIETREENFEGDLPVFVNTLEPGSLSVTKLISEDTTVYDPDQEFVFHVKLIGEDIKDGTLVFDEESGKYIYVVNTEDTGDDNPAPSGSDNQPLLSNPLSSSADVSSLISRNIGLNRVSDWSSVYHAAESEMAGSYAYAVFAGDTLTFFRSRTEYDDKTSGTFTDVAGNTYMGRVYAGIETLEGNTKPSWYDDQVDGTYVRNQIKHVVTLEHQPIKPKTLYEWFLNQSNLLSVDLKWIDSSDVTTMEEMFEACRQLKGIDLSGFDTSKVTNMSETFRECNAAKYIDVSHFDTSKVTTMAHMFRECRNVAGEVDLSHFNTSKVENFECMFYWNDSMTYLDISSWDTSKASTMDSMFWQARHMKRINLGVNFAFQGNDIDYSNYWAELPQPNSLPDPSDDNEYTGKWVLESDSTGTSAMTRSQMANANHVQPGVWTWQINPTKYTIIFTASEAAGSMDNVMAKANQNYQLPANKFRRFGYSFVKWVNQNTGTEYEDKGIIPANTYAIGDVVTLTAVFAPTTIAITDGEFEIILHGNETAIFDNLPAGTSYQVWEDTPDGWLLVKEENSSGIIEPMKTQEAKFTNKYQPNVTAVRFHGTKMLDLSAAEAGQFTFELYDSRNSLLQTKDTLDGGFIQFDTIEYTEDDIGWHTYYVKEKLPDPLDESIEYDTQSKYIRVRVFKRDDKLVSTVTYDDDELVFVNKKRPGMLRISKVGENVSDVNKDDVFTFKITFTNAAGMPLGDGEEIYWYRESDGALQRAAMNIETNSDNLQVNQEKENSAGGASVNGAGYHQLLVNMFNIRPNVLSVTGPVIPNREETDDTDEDGYAYAVLTDSNELIFFRSKNVYSNNTVFTENEPAKDIKGNSYTGIVYTGFEDGADVPWQDQRSNITSVKMAAEQKISPVSTANWFKHFSACTTMDLSELDTSNVEDMSSMFYWCTSLTSLNISGFDTSNVKYMNSMFAGCRSIASLDLHNFDTSNVTTMRLMFSECWQLTSLNVRSFDTSKVTDMFETFYSCGRLTSLDVSNFDTSNVKYMGTMFGRCSSLTSLNVSNFKTSNVVDMGGMFSECGSLISLDLSNFDTSKVGTTFDSRHMKSMFDGCNSLTSLNLSGFNTSNVKDMTYMFRDCSSLTTLDVTDFRTNNVEQMAGMFMRCGSLASIDVSNFDTSKVKLMNNMFNGCSGLTSLDLSNFNTASVTNMADMFNGCSGLTSLNISNFNTAFVTNMEGMFCDCSSLKSIDVSSFVTGRVTKFERMFKNCRSLVNLDLHNFSTMTSTNYGFLEMFLNCSSLETLDISGFDNERATGSRAGKDMFTGCNKLSKVVLGQRFAFKGNNTNNTAFLPTPPIIMYSGRWIREDEAYGPYTPEELTQNYNGRTMSGTWIWALGNDYALVVYDPNDGYTTAEDYPVTSLDQRITMPVNDDVSRPGFVLSGWNTKKDGSGTMFEPGETIKFGEISDQLGHRVYLYAQWTKGQVRSYVVNHFKQSADLNGYDDPIVEIVNVYLAGSDEELEHVVTTERPEPKNFEYFYTPSVQTVEVSKDGQDPDPVNYYYDRMTYKIIFDGNGAEFGHMDSILVPLGVQISLPLNVYQKTGSMFTGWQSGDEHDGNLTTYVDGQKVINLAGRDEWIYLTAQWKENNNPTLTPTSGVIYVTCKAGDSIIIPNLPDGTTYTVEEVEMPDGWSLVEVVGATGSIVSNQTVQVIATNKYKANGEASIVAHKKLIGADMNRDDFSFELVDEDGKVLQLKGNEAVDTNQYLRDEEGNIVKDEDGNPVENPWYGYAPILFDAISYTRDDIGTHTYTIREKASNDATIIYDESEYTVTVTVNDAGKGKLSTEVVYSDNREPAFINSIKPGKLEVKKNITSGNPDQEFSFALHFYDEQNNDVTAELLDTIAAKKVERLYTKHLSNMDDDGNVIKPIVSQDYFEDYNLLPEVQKLHVKITYGEFYGIVVFQGGLDDNEPYYTLNEQGIMAERRTVEYDFIGNYVYIGALSYYAVGEGGGYGVFAEVSAYATGDYLSEDGTFTLKGGETILFDDIPAGIRYEVEEIDIPTDWNLIDSENMNGMIAAGDTAHAVAINEFKTEGVAQIIAYKKLIGGDIKNNQFTFELYEGDDLIRRQGNGSLDTEPYLLDEEGNVLKDENGEAIENPWYGYAPVIFDPIYYTEDDIGTHEYVVREKYGSDEKIIYDENEYTVKVIVTKDERGKLNTEVLYEDDSEPIFINNFEPVRLEIEKELDTWEDGSPVTFIFDVVVKVDDEVVYADVHSMTFNGPGSKSIVIENLPANGVATVKEVYAGAGYKVSGDAEFTVELSEKNKVGFKNTYDEKKKRGYGAQNTFTTEDGETWTWVNDLKEGGE